MKKALSLFNQLCVVFAISVLVVLQSGCGMAGQLSSTTETDLRSQTAQYFGARADEITVTNIKKGFPGITFDAEYKGIVYQCKTPTVFSPGTCKAHGS